MDKEDGRTIRVTFRDLIPIPKWERSLRTKANPPTHHLTSIYHIKYIARNPPQKNKPQRKEEKGKRAQSNSGKYPCTACKRVSGDVNVLEAPEDWMCCFQCNSWYYESCGENNGICDEDGYICKD